jgi:hypothetical protein
VSLLDIIKPKSTQEAKVLQYLTQTNLDLNNTNSNPGVNTEDISAARPMTATIPRPRTARPRTAVVSQAYLERAEQEDMSLAIQQLQVDLWSS